MGTSERAAMDAVDKADLLRRNGYALSADGLTLLYNAHTLRVTHILPED